MPVYNGEKTIVRSLDSILAQTMADLEVLVVNDGSTDDTAALVEQVAARDGRVRLISIPNGGQGAARNLAMGQAQGDYIGFVDSDDTIDPTMYQVMLSRIEDGDVCQCNLLNVHPDGTAKIQLSAIDGVVQVDDPQQYFANYMWGRKHSYECCNKIFKRSFLLDNHITFGNNREVYSEDLLFNIMVAKRLHKIVFVNQPLYHYIAYPNSHSKQFTLERVRKMCRLFELVYDEAFKYQVSQLAVLILMVNLVYVTEDSREIFKRKDVRRYIKNTLVADGNWIHKGVMVGLLTAPKTTLRLYYSRWKG